MSFDESMDHLKDQAERYEAADLAGLLEQQRDELADALELMGKAFGQKNLSYDQKIAVNKANEALRKAGRL